ncbi:MAG: Flp family type IVb pilin [Alphaproteobacteria bacterium]|nr:Flp family type IVb pilin [Alphaproteobacteria bacterium]MCI5057840.1 Flp family type IVb pilin [Flavobacteriales bacterium]
MKIFLTNDGAVTAIEYAIIATLIALVMVAAVQSLGSGASNFYNNITSAFP